MIKVITTAREFQAACNAGLILSSADEYGVPEWLGKVEEFEAMNKLLI
jgi:hypothetical protein